MKIICGKKMQCRTEYTPRAYPGRNLRSLISEDYEEMEGLMTPMEEYTGYDVKVKGQMVPEGAVDIMEVVKGGDPIDIGGGRERGRGRGRGRRVSSSQPAPTKWKLTTNAPPGICDGTSRHSCGRKVGSGCLLYGHHDARGSLSGEKEDGEIVLTIPEEVRNYVRG